MQNQAWQKMRTKPRGTCEAANWVTLSWYLRLSLWIWTTRHVPLRARSKWTAAAPCPLERCFQGASWSFEFPRVNTGKYCAIRKLFLHLCLFVATKQCRIWNHAVKVNEQNICRMPRFCAILATQALRANTRPNCVHAQISVGTRRQ